jgi:predicted membrane channel-forming protein YqfA (hemolysin III family)
MGLEILILKKAAKYASFRMLMGISGKDLVGIYKSITLHKIKRAKGLSFLRKGGVTYVIGQGFFWWFL